MIDVSKYPLSKAAYECDIYSLDTPDYSKLIGVKLVLKPNGSAIVFDAAGPKAHGLGVVSAPDSVGTIQSYTLDDYGNISAYVTGGKLGPGYVTLTKIEDYTNPEISIVPDTYNGSFGANVKGLVTALGQENDALEKAKGEMAKMDVNAAKTAVGDLTSGFITAVKWVGGFIAVLVILNLVIDLMPKKR